MLKKIIKLILVSVLFSGNIVNASSHNNEELIILAVSSKFYSPILKNNDDDEEEFKDKIIYYNAIYLGIEPTKEDAKRKWLSLNISHKNLLKNLKLGIIPVREGDQSMGYKVLAGTLDKINDAKNICSYLKKQQVECKAVETPFSPIDIALPWQTNKKNFAKDGDLPWLENNQTNFESTYKTPESLMELKEVNIGETDINDVIYEDPEGVEIAELEIKEFKVKKKKKPVVRRNRKKYTSVNNRNITRNITRNNSKNRYKRDYNAKRKSVKQRWWIHIGAYKDKKSAEKNWDYLKSVYPKTLRNVGHKITEPYRKQKYKLRLGAFKNEKNASNRCKLLKRQNVNCIVLSE